MNIEKNLRNINFSAQSKIKDSLLANLLERHRQDNAPHAWWKKDSMSFDDLDMVAAAGSNPHGFKPEKK